MLATPHPQKSQLVIEVVALMGVGIALVTKQFAADVQEWFRREAVLAPLRGRWMGKKAKAGPWQRKLLALFRRGEQIRIQRRG